MAKVLADIRFVGVWKCTTKLKEVVFNNSKLSFPEKLVKIVSISNTASGTVMYIGQPGPDAKGFPAIRAAGIGVEFSYMGKNDKYILKETIRINIVDVADLIGESDQEWQVPGRGVVAKTITQSEYHRIGRMKTL